MDIPSFGRVLFAFAFVMGLMLCLAWMVRKLKLDQKMQGLGRRRGSLRIEESLSVDGKRRLIVVGHAESRYILLLGPNGDTVLERLNGQEPKGE